MNAYPTPLLLHSLSEFHELLDLLLVAHGGSAIAEVGAELGLLTRSLIQKLEDGKLSRLTVIDPKPSPDLSEYVASRGDLGNRLTLQRKPSLEAIPLAGLHDCFLLDGDHNYYTVFNELVAIARLTTPGDRYPMVLVHDVGWPCGRRDLYYAPGDIPPHARHCHEYSAGVHIDVPGVVSGGFRGEGAFAFAQTEGGGANGVLTAIEDFLATRPDLDQRILPAIFGLAIIAPKDDQALAAFDAAGASGPLRPLLERMEDNRLRLYLRVLELQDQLTQQAERTLWDILKDRVRQLWSR